MKPVQDSMHNVHLAPSRIRLPQAGALSIWPGAHRPENAGVASKFTDHARARMQQRGIPAAAIEALLDYGNARHLHSKGRELVFFDKKHTSAGAQAADKLRRTYAILGSDGTVITVGHRYRRIPRG